MLKDGVMIMFKRLKESQNDQSKPHTNVVQFKLIKDNNKKTSECAKYFLKNVQTWVYYI